MGERRGASERASKLEREGAGERGREGVAQDGGRGAGEEYGGSECTIELIHEDLTKDREGRKERAFALREGRLLRPCEQPICFSLHSRAPHLHQPFVRGKQNSPPHKKPLIFAYPTFSALLEQGPPNTWHLSERSSFSSIPPEESPFPLHCSS